jgi:uncharacterized protein YcfJ
MKIGFISAVMAVVLGVSAGCANISKEQGGAGVGAVVGGLVGSQFGSGGTQILATALGVGAGALIGNRLGKYLDDQDKQKLANATIKTAETGKPESVVSSDSGTTMRTTTIPTPKTQTASNTQGECKTVRQVIVLNDGTKQQEDVKVCRGVNGWEIAES